MNLNFPSPSTTDQVFNSLKIYLDANGFHIANYDDTRPWGGFFVIEESEAEQFIAKYFPHLKKEDLIISGKLSPKILVVAPGKRLSWQYHHRRAEIWKLIGGSAKVATSDDDTEKNEQLLSEGDIVQLTQGQRHRLIGAEQWGIVAEIWQHTDVENPSDENDIIRVQDDFGR